ncbi:MAG: sodium:proton exchanger [Acidimicrobiia bacterium]|nr:cation:proton antiporter [Acidimicrobiia bacterium]MBT8193025.1 cation:proton antiporter [Acidimicrobiia bacterium]NNF87628.1 sodium:proton exchanger [Acidimicrobiia bacterium]NNJ46708.1 sodium:proton exchanger [Acidimicrobiia bacterium]NNL12231.1 sodium:proton exchanger [Acidimicrobiia bacterium]
MAFPDVALLSGFVLAYALVSRRLESTPITGPMVFVGFGLIVGSGGFDLVEIGMEEGAVRTLAEATLVLLLFTDAIRIDLGRLRRQLELPARLLGIGLPLTVMAGTAVALVVFPDIGLWEAALLAAILAPTDAALGRAVVANPRVPIRVRQALNVESGLNDGLMLPVITLFLALAAVGIDLETPEFWAEFVAEQVGFGLLVGAVGGYVGGRLIREFAGRNWMDGAFRQLATLAVGVGAFAAAESVDGNGFVAAFVAGLAFGAAARDYCRGVYDFAEDQGELLALLTFLFFGAALAGPALDALSWQIGLYALLSLSVVRITSVAISLAGTRLKAPSVAYLGWFGPRGLASILFGLFILEEAALPVSAELFDVVIWTVLASVVLHGVTSVWLSERYAGWFSTHRREHMQEAQTVDEMPTR